MVEAKAYGWNQREMASIYAVLSFCAKIHEDQSGW